MKVSSTDLLHDSTITTLTGFAQSITITLFDLDSPVLFDQTVVTIFSIMSTNYWGKLVRVVGGSDSELIPEVILLFDQKNFFGRVPNADTAKFSHSQQFVVPLPYLSSTHFCIEMISSDNGKETVFMMTDYSRNGTFFRQKQDRKILISGKLNQWALLKQL